MDQGQCRPEFDQETAFWGYDCTYVPEGAPKNEALHIKISPQFSFATPFINGRAKVLLGCRLASLACVSYRGMVGHINTDGNIVFFEREDGKLNVPLKSQVKQFLAESNLAFSTIEDMVIVERSEKLFGFSVGPFRTTCNAG